MLRELVIDPAVKGDRYIETAEPRNMALQVLAELVESGKPAHELLHLFDPLPQIDADTQANLDRVVTMFREAMPEGRGGTIEDIRPPMWIKTEVRQQLRTTVYNLCGDRFKQIV